MKPIPIEVIVEDPVTDEYVTSLYKDEKTGIIKVTKIEYYKVDGTYRGIWGDSVKVMKEQINRWFVDFLGLNHAGREGSKVPFSRLEKVEIIKYDNDSI